MNITRKLGALIAIIAGFAFPTWALADHGGDGQSGGDDNGAATTTTTTTPTTETPAPRTESYELRGVVVSTDPATDQVMLKVTKTNHGGRGRSLRGQTLTFDLTGARLKVRDNNADGMRDINDVAAGDLAEVRARLARPLPSSFSGPIAAQRFEDKTNNG